MYVLVMAISIKVPTSKDFTYTIKCSCQTKLKRFNFKNQLAFITSFCPAGNC